MYFPSGYSRGGSGRQQPDTIVLRGAPSRWFAEPRVSSKPSMLVTHTIFSTFGKIRYAGRFFSRLTHSYISTIIIWMLFWLQSIGKIGNEKMRENHPPNHVMAPFFVQKKFECLLICS